MGERRDFEVRANDRRLPGCCQTMGDKEGWTREMCLGRVSNSVLVVWLAIANIVKRCKLLYLSFSTRKGGIELL